MECVAHPGFSLGCLGAWMPGCLDACFNDVLLGGLGTFLPSVTTSSGEPGCALSAREGGGTIKKIAMRKKKRERERDEPVCQFLVPRDPNSGNHKTQYLFTRVINNLSDAWFFTRFLYPAHSRCFLTLILLHLRT